MEVEGGAGGGWQPSGDDTSGWQTGPVGEDGADGFIGVLGRDPTVLCLVDRRRLCNCGNPSAFAPLATHPLLAAGPAQGSFQ